MDGFVGRRWKHFLVRHDFLDSMLGHGAMWFFEVLGHAPQQIQLCGAKTMCSERSLGFKGRFGLRGQMEEDEESVPDLEVFSGEFGGMVFEFGISFEKPVVIDLVSVAF